MSRPPCSPVVRQLAPPAPTFHLQDNCSTPCFPLSTPYWCLIDCTDSAVQAQIQQWWTDTAPLTMQAQVSTWATHRQREFQAGRWAVAKLFAAATMTPTQHGSLVSANLLPAPLPISSLRLPEWPESWTGSISHSGQWVLAALAPMSKSRAMGLDLQARLSGKQAHNLSTRIAHPDELSVLKQARLLSPEDREEAVATSLTLLFSLKETLYKALFPLTGQFQPFAAAELLALTPDQLFELPFEPVFEYPFHPSSEACSRGYSVIRPEYSSDSLQTPTQQGTARLRLTRDWSEHWCTGTELTLSYALNAWGVVTTCLIAADMTTP